MSHLQAGSLQAALQSLLGGQSNITAPRNTAHCAHNMHIRAPQRCLCPVRHVIVAAAKQHTTMQSAQGVVHMPFNLVGCRTWQDLDSEQYAEQCCSAACPRPAQNHPSRCGVGVGAECLSLAQNLHSDDGAHTHHWQA